MLNFLATIYWIVPSIIFAIFGDDPDGSPLYLIGAFLVFIYDVVLVVVGTYFLVFVVFLDGLMMMAWLVERGAFNWLFDLITMPFDD